MFVFESSFPSLRIRLFLRTARHVRKTVFSFIVQMHYTVCHPEKTSLTHPLPLLSYLTCQQATEVTETNSATICSGLEFWENTSTNKHSQANRQANTQTFLNTNSHKQIHSLAAATCGLITCIPVCLKWSHVKHPLTNIQRCLECLALFPCWRHITDLIYTSLIWHTDAWSFPLE